MTIAATKTAAPAIIMTMDGLTSKVPLAWLRSSQVKISVAPMQTLDPNLPDTAEDERETVETFRDA